MILRWAGCSWTRMGDLGRRRAITRTYNLIIVPTNGPDGLETVTDDEGEWNWAA